MLHSKSRKREPSLFQCTVSILWALVMFWCGYVNSCSILYDSLFACVIRGRWHQTMTSMHHSITCRSGKWFWKKQWKLVLRTLSERWDLLLNFQRVLYQCAWVYVHVIRDPHKNSSSYFKTDIFVKATLQTRRNQGQINTFCQGWLPFSSESFVFPLKLEN